jgi:hypothetical protein
VDAVNVGGTSEADMRIVASVGTAAIGLSKNSHVTKSHVAKRRCPLMTSSTRTKVQAAV